MFAVGIVLFGVGGAGSVILWYWLVDHRIDLAVGEREGERWTAPGIVGMRPASYDEAGRRWLPWFWISIGLQLVGAILLMVNLT